MAPHLRGQIFLISGFFQRHIAEVSSRLSRTSIATSSSSIFAKSFPWIVLPLRIRLQTSYNYLHKLAFSGGWLPIHFFSFRFSDVAFQCLDGIFDCSPTRLKQSYWIGNTTQRKETHFAGIWIASFFSLAFSGGWLPTILTLVIFHFPFHSGAIAYAQYP